MEVEAPVGVWRWQPIERTEDLSGEADHEADDARYDERWLALALLASERNVGTRDGYRRDLNTFVSWWQGRRPRNASPATPLDAARVDLERYADMLSEQEPPLASATRRSGWRLSPPSIGDLGPARSSRCIGLASRRSHSHASS